VIARIEAGQGKASDVDLLESIASKVEGHTICPFGEALAWPVRSYSKQFRDEFLRHVKEGKCPFGPIPVSPRAMSGAVA
jgi:NADH-quinone oxidoreductase subunit F